MDAIGYDEVLTVADGLGRTAIEALASLAFDEANVVRAALGGRLSPDFSARAGSIIRAEAWADVLCHLDRTGAVTFSRQDFQANPPENAGGSAVSRYGFVRGFALTYGSKPFNFYERPAARTA